MQLSQTSLTALSAAASSGHSGCTLTEKIALFRTQVYPRISEMKLSKGVKTDLMFSKSEQEASIPFSSISAITAQICRSNLRARVLDSLDNFRVTEDWQNVPRYMLYV